MDAVLDDCMEVGPAYLHEQPRRHPLLCQFDAGVQEFEGAFRRRCRGRTPVGNCSLWGGEAVLLATVGGRGNNSSNGNCQLVV